MKFRLICMGFDGEYKKESPKFNTIQEAWEYSNDLGSKWHFYPFHFVTTESFKTIRDTCLKLEYMNGWRTTKVVKTFLELSKDPDMQEIEPEEYMWGL